MKTRMLATIMAALVVIAGPASALGVCATIGPEEGRSRIGTLLSAVTGSA